MGIFKKARSKGTVQALTANGLVKPALHLIETFESRGFSKIGSTPDVPSSFEWPVWNGRTLAFLMQIKFSEVNGDGAIPELPASGLLYVFYDQEQSTWGFDPKDEGSWRLLFFDEGCGLKMRRYPKDMEVRYKGVILAPKPIMTYPPTEDARLEALSIGVTDEQYDEYDDFRETNYDGKPFHHLWGYPDPEQGADMELDCELASNGLYCGDETGYEDPRAKELEKNKDSWRLLLQIDSDDEAEMMWGDCGRLYFWIKEDDLKSRRFDKAWMILQCG
jgi:uncharacterized protein YwqG